MVNAFGLTYAVPTYVLDHSESETRTCRVDSVEFFVTLSKDGQLEKDDDFPREIYRIFPKVSTFQWGSHIFILVVSNVDG